MGVVRKLNNEIEIGFGIHGEKGLKVLPFTNNTEVIRLVLDLFARVVSASDEVVVLLNNLGALTDLETGSLTLQILEDCKRRNWVVKAFISGRVMTSLVMHGFSITVLKGVDETILE